jgi:hypothetical protein
MRGPGLPSGHHERARVVETVRAERVAKERQRGLLAGGVRLQVLHHPDESVAEPVVLDRDDGERLQPVLEPDDLGETGTGDLLTPRQTAQRRI